MLEFAGFQNKILTTKDEADMKMRYMITFGERFWKKIDEINDIMSNGFSPVRVEAVDPHSRASRYIYPFNDMPSGDSFTNVMNLVSILENTLFPFQYAYLGPDVTISILLEDASGNKTRVEIFRYPKDPVVAWYDSTIQSLKMVLSRFKRGLGAIGICINNFIYNL